LHPTTVRRTAKAMNTALDIAHLATQTDSGDAARLRFFERLADAELFVLLETEAQGAQIAPRVFPVDGTNFVLAFDLPERLAAFAEGPAPYAALSGRTLAGMLAAEGMGLGLNLDVAPSSQLLDAAAIAWLARTLENTPQEAQDTPDTIYPPSGLPEVLLGALDTKLAMATGLARSAYLVGVTYAGNRRTHLLGFVGALSDAEPSLARAVAEALTFSGVEAGALDVGFFRAADPVTALLAKHGLRFDLPQPQVQQTPGANPGMDPTRPPKLR
jgi:hypothetical protein